ncbi:MAG: septum formation initiator family protein [Candidatus Saccharimonadales bacterium]
MSVITNTVKIFQTYFQGVTAYIVGLRDVRNVGQLVFICMVLLISWSGVKAIQSNYELQKQVQAINERNKVAQLENSNLELENQYYNTSQYLEVTARQNFGLARPGETVLLVPKSVALANTVPMPVQEDATSSKDTFVQSNIRAWLDFFVHRNSSSN